MWGHNPDSRLMLKIDDQRTPADRNVCTPQLVKIKDKDQFDDEDVTVDIYSEMSYTADPSKSRVSHEPTKLTEKQPKWMENPKEIVIL